MSIVGILRLAFGSRVRLARRSGWQFENCFWPLRL